MAWIIYVMALVGYYALHSLMASEFMKSLFRKYIGFSDQVYRLLFNAIAVITTFLLVHLYRQVTSDLDGQGHVSGYFLAIFGLAIIFWAVINYDLMTFVGIKKEAESELLVTSGLNQYSRHPLYLGVLIALLGWLIVDHSLAALITLIVTWFYVYIGIALEEKKLVARFGKNYEDYQVNVPKLWPLNFSKKKA